MVCLQALAPMSQVVTVMNMKGGVGKTTVALHIGGLLGRYKISGKNRRVLLIDYDAQFNLSQAVLRSKRYFALEKEGRTCLTILQEPEVDLDPFSLQTPTSPDPPSLSDVVESLASRVSGSCVDVVPSTLDLMYIALGTAGPGVGVIEDRFRKFVDECRKGYDLVLIDCHPAGSILTKTSLQNSDHVLIPVAPQAYAARGIVLMQRFVAANRLPSTTPGVSILFNNTSRSGPPSSTEAAVRADPKLAPLCFTNRLHYYKVFSEPFEGRGFVWSSTKPWSNRAFRNLWAVAEEFVDKVKV